MLIRVTPTNDVQLNLLRSMQDSSVDFWHPPSFIGKNVEFRVAPESYTDMAATLNAYGLPHQIVVSDIGKLIREEEQTVNLRRVQTADKAFDFENYHTYQEVYSHLHFYLTFQQR
jgi:Carboxypeptidase activation peptide